MSYCWLAICLAWVINDLPCRSPRYSSALTQPYSTMSFSRVALIQPYSTMSFTRVALIQPYLTMSFTRIDLRWLRLLDRKKTGNIWQKWQIRDGPFAYGWRLDSSIMRFTGINANTRLDKTLTLPMQLNNTSKPALRVLGRCPNQTPLIHLGAFIIIRDVCFWQHTYP